MTRLLIPFVFIAAAIGLFMTYTSPTYQSVKGLQIQANAFDDALSKAQELAKVRDDLLQQRSSFAPADLNKLQRILPDNVDNIRLIIDVNNIAARHHLILSNVDLGDVTKGTSSDAAAAEAGVNPVGSAVVTFSVASTYDDFLAFMQDLEHSLRLVDVQKISFTVGQTTTNTYSFSVRTYWLQ